jgi:hypothetical protein
MVVVSMFVAPVMEERRDSRRDRDLDRSLRFRRRSSMSSLVITMASFRTSPPFVPTGDSPPLFVPPDSGDSPPPLVESSDDCNLFVRDDDLRLLVLVLVLPLRSLEVSVVISSPSPALAPAKEEDRLDLESLDPLRRGFLLCRDDSDIVVVVVTDGAGAAGTEDDVCPDSGKKVIVPFPSSTP